MLDASDVEMLFLIAVMIVALKCGRSRLAPRGRARPRGVHFFFVPPAYTLNVSDARDFLAFAMMLPIGIVTGTLTLRIRDNSAPPSRGE